MVRHAQHLLTAFSLVVSLNLDVERIMTSRMGNTDAAARNATRQRSADVCTGCSLVRDAEAEEPATSGTRLGDESLALEASPTHS